jgi:hypothetical protein
MRAIPFPRSRIEATTDVTNAGQDCRGLGRRSRFHAGRVDGAGTRPSGVSMTMHAGRLAAVFAISSTAPRTAGRDSARYELTAGPPPLLSATAPHDGSTDARYSVGSVRRGSIRASALRAIRWTPARDGAVVRPLRTDPMRGPGHSRKSENKPDGSRRCLFPPNRYRATRGWSRRAMRPRRVERENQTSTPRPVVPRPSPRRHCPAHTGKLLVLAESWTNPVQIRPLQGGVATIGRDPCAFLFTLFIYVWYVTKMNRPEPEIARKGRKRPRKEFVVAFRIDEPSLSPLIGQSTRYA